MHHLVTAALYILAIGLFNSISLLAVFHVLMIPPIIYVIYKKGLKESFADLHKSAWALLGLCVIIVLSVVFNQDLISNGFKNATKIKYYVISVLSIIAFKWYFFEVLSKEERDKNITRFITTFLIATCVGTISGLIGFYTGFNPLKMKEVGMTRNSGMFGMVVTYGHQASLLGALLIVPLLNSSLRSKFTNPILLTFTGALNVVALFLSYTRGAILAFIAGTVFINKKLTVAVIALCVTGIIGISAYNPNFFNNHVLRIGAVQERVGCWISALYAFKERPILGYGFKNLEPHARDIKQKYDIMAAHYHGHAHNNFLELLATTGIFGFILFMIWLGLWAKESITRKDDFSKISLCVGSAFVVGGLTQTTFIDGENLFFILTFYSLYMVYISNKDKKASN